VSFFLHMKNCLFVFGVLFLSLPLRAQQEIVNVNYLNNVLNQDTLMGQNHHFEASVLFPIYKNAKHLIGGKWIYTYDQFSGIDPLLNQRLQGIDLNLLWKLALNEKSSIQLGFLIGGFSDFTSVTADVLRYRMVGNYTHRFSEDLLAGLGLIYNRHFNAHMWIPMATVDWKLNSRWKVSGMLPIKPKISYFINEKWNWVNEGAGHAETFKVKKAVIELTGWTLMSSLQYTLKKHHRFQAGVGLTLSQRLRYYQDPKEMKWKLYNFDIKANEEPMVDLMTKGGRCNIGYTFLL
jgi:hypothetical protein